MAEIKISELSIGDWVIFTPDKNIYVAKPRFTSAPAKITGTYCGGEVILEIECHREFMAIPLSCIKPIPLTPEILEKNGFVEGSEYRWSNPSIGCACLRLGTKYWDIRIGGRNRAYRPTRISIDNIVHTHQLQHALRLAGVEKEIEI